MISSSIEYQNAILDLLNGKINTKDNVLKEVYEDSSLKGGEEATNALEKIFIEGGCKRKENTINNINDLKSTIESKMEGGTQNDDTDVIQMENDIRDNNNDLVEDDILITSDDDLDYDEKNDSEELTEDKNEIEDIMNEILKNAENPKNETSLMGGGIQKRRAIIINDLDKYPYTLRHFKKQ